MIWLALSAVTMVTTAVYHSYRGEKYVIQPLLAIDDPVLDRPFMRKVVRAAWHLSSYFMAVFAVVVLWPGAPHGLIMAIGAAWLADGIYIFISWRGRHRGSLMLMAAGIFALLGALA